MKILLLTLLALSSLGAQTLNFSIHDPSGKLADVPLPANYQFTDTQVNSAASLILRVSNPTSTPIQVGTIFFAAGTANFVITGTYVKFTLAPQSADFEEFTVSFVPGATGPATGNLQVGYTTQVNGCSLTCPATIASVSTFGGNGVSPQLSVSYGLNSGNIAPLAALQSIDFGNVSTSQSGTAVLSLVNNTSSPLTTAINIQSAVYASSAFTTTAPSGTITIPANNAASPVLYNIEFAPGQTGLTSATLVIGSNTYPLLGTGVVIANVDALQISYVDATGVRTLPQAATPIGFGQPPVGTNSTLTFTVANPTTSFDAVPVQTIAVTGAAFAATGLPNLPASILPGQSIQFQIVFAPSQAGAQTGTLAIGTRQFSLTGIGADLPLPAVSLVFDTQTFTSQQQPHISIQLAGPATFEAIGTLSMQFTSAAIGVTDDPAIQFLATSSRSLQITVADGSTLGTFGGQSALTFQTGTTAGRLRFTLTFPNKPAITQSFDILPSPVQITSSSALRQSPNLVLTISGYDNTYSAGQLLFNFYDTKGNLLTPNGISVDAHSNFQTYFNTVSKAGGAFSLQAKFPVTGDITQIGSVAITLTNSSGLSQVKQVNFQ